ncbi:MAG: hypothetical protein D6798_03150, partial [Deltaproteobacteria bacterium]
MDRFIYALAADALEPGDALALERARVRPGLADRIDHARRIVAEPGGGGPWLLGVQGALSLGGLHLDGGPWRGGDRLPIVLGADLPPDGRLVVTVKTRAGTRTLSPVDGVYVRVEQLRRIDAGYALDLILEDIVGLHRITVQVLAGDRDDVLARG